MAKTKTQIMEQGLLKLGWVEVESNSSKVQTFTHPDHETKLFLGKAASLRKGNNKTSSMKVGPKFYQQVYEAGSPPTPPPQPE